MPNLEIVWVGPGEAHKVGPLHGNGLAQIRMLANLRLNLPQISVILRQHLIRAHSFALGSNLVLNVLNDIIRWRNEILVKHLCTRLVRHQFGPGTCFEVKPFFIHSCVGFHWMPWGSQFLVEKRESIISLPGKPLCVLEASHNAQKVLSQHLIDGVFFIQIQTHCGFSYLL